MTAPAPAVMEARKIAHEILNENGMRLCDWAAECAHNMLCDRITSALASARTAGLDSALVEVKAALRHNLWGKQGRPVEADIVKRFERLKNGAK